MIFLQQLTEVYQLIDSDRQPETALLAMPFDYQGRRRLITYEKPATKKYNALFLELRNFIRSVAGLEQPAVDGYAARAALDVAMRIQAAIDRSGPAAKGEVPS